MDSGNPIRSTRGLRGEEAYVYGLKARAQRHHCMAHGTFSVDLTALEAARRLYSRRVRPITYVAIYLKATALAIARHPEANAILFRRPFGFRVIKFERVDVSLPITRRIDGREVTLIATVRGAAEKSLADIQKEVRQLKRGSPEGSPALQRFRHLSRMPFWLTQLIHRRLTRDPEFYGRSVGTCGLTLLDGAEWGEHLFPVAPSSVVFGIGSARREAVVEGEAIVIRRMLNCCLMIDNYVIPGPTAARLAREFHDLLASAEVVTRELHGC